MMIIRTQNLLFLLKLSTLTRAKGLRPVHLTVQVLDLFNRRFTPVHLTVKVLDLFNRRFTPVHLTVKVLDLFHMFH